MKRSSLFLYIFFICILNIATIHTKTSAAEETYEASIIGINCTELENNYTFIKISENAVYTKFDITPILENIQNTPRTSCSLNVSDLYHEGKLIISVNLTGDYSSTDFSSAEFPAAIILVEVAYTGESNTPRYFYLPVEDSVTQEEDNFTWIETFLLENIENDKDDFKITLSIRRLNN